MVEHGIIFKRENAKGKFSPKIKDWQLFFSRHCENRDKIMKMVHKFLHGRAKQIHLPVESISVLGGRVYGKDGYADGTEFFTSNVKTLKRVKGDRGQEIILAITKNGHEYYFEPYGFNRHMGMMLHDISNHGKLKETPGYYLPYAYLTHEFL